MDLPWTPGRSAGTQGPATRDASRDAGPTTVDPHLRPRGRRPVRGFRHNGADPLLRRTRSRPDHNRVRDVPSPVSVLGLAPPPPAGGDDPRRAGA